MSPSGLPHLEKETKATDDQPRTSFGLRAKQSLPAYPRNSKKQQKTAASQLPTLPFLRRRLNMRTVTITKLGNVDYEPVRTQGTCGWCGMRAIVAVLIFCETPTNRDTVAFHVRRLALLSGGPPATIRRARDLFQIGNLQRRLKWLMSGRPTFQQWADKLEEEQLALVRLGYYDRKWLPWKDRDREWESAFTNTAVWRGSGVMLWESRRANEICITARPSDISEVDAIIRAKLGKPGGTPQPVSPEANLIPAAAASGR